jgi:bifunctional non-homologous end joining protein LigD
LAKAPKAPHIPLVEETACSRLRCTEGSSDKVYNLDLKEEGGGWVVSYANGRYGSTLVSGTKTASGPVPYPAARKIYDTVLREKLKGGYIPTGADAEAYIQADRNHSGIQCALLNPIDIEDAAAYINDPDWIAQEKHNGRRCLFRKQGDSLEAINRTGLTVGYPPVVGRALNAASTGFIIDGEAIGETLHVFDLLMIAGVDVRSDAYESRLLLLQDLISQLAGPGSPIVLVATAWTTEEKQRLWDSVMAANGEGLVFKRRDAHYPVGRPASGGSQLKCKFWESCSAVVGGINTQRSVSLKLLSDGAWTDVGNCTIPVNHAVPAVGEVVEIRYLFANSGGCLQEPTYLGVRKDVAADNCVLTQLKLKPEPGSTAPGFR